MDEVIEELVSMLEAFTEDSRVFDAMAKSSKRFYDALIKAGFSKEEAIEIVAHQGSLIKSGQ